MHMIAWVGIATGVPFGLNHAMRGFVVHAVMPVDRWLDSFGLVIIVSVDLRYISQAAEKYGAENCFANHGKTLPNYDQIHYR